MLKFAIIGFGGLGKGHFLEMRNNRQDEIKLVAICDVDPSQFNKPMNINIGGSPEIPDLSAYKIYYDAEEMKKER